MARPQQSPGVYWTKTEQVTTTDGAVVRYRLLRDPAHPDGPVVVLLGGFLCPDTWWHDLTPALVEAGYGVLMLHYRGIATSSMPEGAELSIERFAGDAIDVIHAAGVDRVALIGHSMGGQVMTEVVRRLGDRVTALTYLTATYRAPTQDLFGAGRVWHPAVTQAAKLLGVLARPAPVKPIRRFLGVVPLLPAIRLLSAMGPRTPDDIFASYTDHLLTRDDTYVLGVVRALQAHDGGDVLPTIAAPTLIICGDADPFTPLAVARHMEATIPDAELVVVPDTTHGVVIEAPEEVNAAIIGFLDRSVRGTAPGPAVAAGG